MTVFERLRAAVRFRWTYFRLRCYGYPLSPAMAATTESLLEALLVGEGEALPSYYRRPR